MHGHMHISVLFYVGVCVRHVSSCVPGYACIVGG